MMNEFPLSGRVLGERRPDEDLRLTIGVTDHRPTKYSNDWGTPELQSGHSYAEVLILGSVIPGEYHVEEYIGKQAAERQMGIDEDT